MLLCSRCWNAVLYFNPSFLWNSFVMTNNLLQLHIGLSVGDYLSGIFIVSVWFLSRRGKNAMLLVPKMGCRKH